MTITATAPAATTPGRVQVHSVNQARVLKMEWIKFTTLRSTWIALAIAMAGTVAVGALASWAIASRWSHLDLGERLTFSPITQSLTGVYLAQLVIGVLGVLFISSEYSTGMVRATLSVAPHRLPVLWAKQLIFAVVTFVLMLATAFVAFFVGQGLLGSHGTTLSAPDALRSIVGVAVYLTLVGIIAVSSGFILRNTAGGIASVVGLIIVLPALAHVLPQSWQHNYVPYLPSNAGGALYTIHPDPGTLSPWAGFLVMCLWAAAFVVVAAVLLKRRDA